MNEKIINVYFGSDCLPYKDTERQVHFPICGNAFLGASNTTKIRFYYDRIWDTATTWVSVAKLPNGKQGSQVLSKSSDDNGNYAELELSNWYTQAKGDVYIALQGYSGGVEYSYDDETGLYEITGTPTIQTTGSIKLAINYAPIGDSADYNDEFTTYQEILAALGDKVDKITTSGTNAYTHTGSTQGQIAISKLSVADSLVQRGANGEINVSATPYNNLSATSKKYVDDSIASAISSVYKYKGSVATYDDLPSSDLTIGDVYNVEDTGDNYAWTGTTWDKLAGDIDLSSYATKDYVDTGLSGKQNTLVSGVNIKTINNNSLLGTGNIDIQGGGGGAWGEITGDIQDQTDLQNELTNIREVAEGKCKTFVLSYSTVAPTEGTFVANRYKDADGNPFATWSALNTYINGRYFLNPDFNSNYDDISLGGDSYFITDTNIIYFDDGSGILSSDNHVQVGDIFLVVETNVPDRWSAGSGVYHKLETSKVDLSGLAGLDDLANEYDSTLTYTKGEVVEHSGKIYRAKQDISTAEAWDSTHWEQVNVASDFVNLTGTQVISGEKSFNNKLKITNGTHTYTYLISEYNNFEVLYDSTRKFAIYNNNVCMCANNFHSGNNNLYDLGTSQYNWKDGYFSGQLLVGMGGSTIWDYTKGVKFGNSAYIIGNAYDELGIRSGSSIYFRINSDTKLALSSSSLTPRGTSGTVDLGSSSYAWKDLYLSGKIYIGPSANTIYEDSSQRLALTYHGEDRFIVGSTGIVSSTRIYPSTNNSSDLGRNVAQWKNIYLGGYLGNANSTYGLTLPDTTSFTANKEIATTDIFAPTSVSISDGGTITDSTLKTLIQNEQPIKLNGFTCYFSCDDGTNYQYVNTRYDSSANKNHINVITINKSTWVATFHTSDLALS